MPLESKMLLYYEKDGVVEEFTEDNYPWQDSTWKWKETKTVVIKENKAEIHDFVLTDSETGEEVTDSLLYRADDVFLLVAYDLEKAKKRQLKRANELAAWCAEHGFTFYALTSTGPADIQRIKRELGIDYAFANADEIMLKTVIRANPGLALLHRGVIVDKWHGNDLPRVSDWSDQPLAEAATHRRQLAERSIFWLYGGLALLALGLFVVYAVSFRKKKQ